MGEPMERTGVFAGDDPLVLLQSWMDSAAESEPNDPNAMSLATVDQNGLPNVRIVLLKEIEADSVVFYTNYTSAKGQELDHAGTAALCLHWKSLRRQIRLRGTVSREDGAQADAYYQSRGIDNRLGAWASQQSAPLASRQHLLDRVEEMRAKYGETPPRPAHWGGYRLVPLEIEFWCDGVARLHDRFTWRRANPQENWDIQRLNP